MKVLGLNGKQYHLKISGHKYRPGETRPRSQYHVQARELLNTLFPADIILEEVILPGSDNLTVDFFVPQANLMVEVHGEQHYKFNPHFHKNILGFINSK